MKESPLQTLTKFGTRGCGRYEGPTTANSYKFKTGGLSQPNIAVAVDIKCLPVVSEAPVVDDCKRPPVFFSSIKELAPVVGGVDIQTQHLSSNPHRGEFRFLFILEDQAYLVLTHLLTTKLGA